MGEQREFLGRLVDLMDSAGVPYRVTGSVGRSFYGRPRATNDIDMVIAPTDSQFSDFLSHVGPDYYVSEAAAWEAFRSKSAFNIIDTRTGWKADLRIRQTRAFSLEEFRRRRRASILGMDVWVASAEDVILSKLEWAEQGRPDRRIHDALAVLLVQHENVDKDYLRNWARELGVQDSLTGLLQEAERERESQ